MQQSDPIGHAGPDLCQAIVEQAPEAIIFADRQGLIRLWNGGAVSVFGHTADEAMGQSLDIIIPERLRRAHWDGFNHAVETGQQKYVNRVLTTRSMHKNGARLYVDLSFALVRDGAGAVIGALAVGRDCTARYLADGALRARLKELEDKTRDGA
ncbi:MAG: PAS domain S-box protein [Burkholderiaceae bacterium]|nr:MAG: PAS domain S-box protein [Burkholderiaceae bacterium]TBR76466.1 MAG: PAS domain S-box protein [Burkholderiaceae bacterium]